MRTHNSLIALICLLTCVVSALADDKSPDQIFKDKGLTKFGIFYVLDVDAQLPTSLRTMRQAQAKMQDYTKKRAAIESDIQLADTSIALWYSQYRTLNEQLAATTNDVEHNRLVGPINSLVSKIQEGKIFKDQREKDLSQLADPSDDYVAIVMDLSDKMEAAQKQYDVLASDDDLKTALAKINETARPKMKLGPSARFVQELVEIRKLRKTINTAVIKFTIENGVPQVNVKLNGNFTEQMVVDSGAAVMTLSADVARQIGLTPLDSDPTVRLTVANGKTVDARLTHIKSVRLAQFTVENVECAILPASVSGSNLLGDTFLRNFIYRMDLGTKELHMSQIVGKTTPTTNESSK
jgi:clan AA aspartic protease (TIGR02281 family)